MFNKILIANRGEIALRVICACRELGIKTVAVYSEADEHSLHVRFADEDVCIGPARSLDSYLNVPAIISAAEITGADAIHPGYGFLSESAYLAEVCEACHIKFIGPYPNVIRLMGDKARARRAMKKAGVPVLPGSDGPVQGEDAGDQGRQGARLSGHHQGRRRRRRPRHARRPVAPTSSPKSLKTATREAEAAFGVGDVYLEKYVESPRHIEIQVLGDHHGNVVHLGERECSIQRRHQKLIEEAPSVALTEKQRRRLGATVVDAARAVQYTNAGTFEFLMDPAGHFYFLEANTRLQVEHPGHRVHHRHRHRQGTDPDRGRPAAVVQAERHRVPGPCDRVPDQRRGSGDVRRRVPGVIHAFSVPGGPGVRVDSYAHSECTVSPYYDSLIAKIITYGRDRREAIARMRRTLEMTVVDGIKTSIPLHLKILADPDFIAGRLSTSFMERFMPERRRRPRQAGRVRLRVSAVRHRASASTALRHSRRRRCAARGARSRCESARRLARRRRPPGPAAREDARRAGRCSSWPTPMAAALPRGRRDVHRQRPRRRRAAGRRATACTSARTICRRR